MLASFIAVLTAAAPAALPTPVPPVPCPRFGEQPAGCVPPPLREAVEIRGVWRVLDGSHPADAATIRRPSMIAPFESRLPTTDFPEALRRGAEGGNAQVTVRLIIAADGAARSCEAVSSEAWLIGAAGAPRIDLPADPALAANVCALVRSNRTFRPGIDMAGNRIEAPIDVTVSYSRQRHLGGLSPAPPPPSRFLGTQPYGRAADWPPRYALLEPIRFTEPKFKEFLTDRSNLPERAVVGILMKFGQDGTALGCTVKVPSTDLRLDAASCAALKTVRNIPSRWQVRDLPVEVEWKRDRASMKLGTGSVLPGLAQPIAILPADVPAGERPKQAVRVRILLDSAGQPVSCMVDGPSYDDALDAASCRIALAQGRFTGGKDGFGRPAASGMDLRVDWSRGQISLPSF